MVSRLWSCLKYLCGSLSSTYLQPAFFLQASLDCTTATEHTYNTHAYTHTGADSLQLMVSPLEGIWEAVGGTRVKGCSETSPRMTCNANIIWRGFYTPFDSGVGGISKHQIRYTFFLFKVLCHSCCKERAGKNRAYQKKKSVVKLNSFQKSSWPH